MAAPAQPSDAQPPVKDDHHREVDRGDGEKYARVVLIPFQEKVSSELRVEPDTFVNYREKGFKVVTFPNLPEGDGLTDEKKRELQIAELKATLKNVTNKNDVLYISGHGQAGNPHFHLTASSTGPKVHANDVAAVVKGALPEGTHATIKLLSCHGAEPGKNKEAPLAQHFADAMGTDYRGDITGFYGAVKATLPMPFERPRIKGKRVEIDKKDYPAHDHRYRFTARSAPK